MIGLDSGNDEWQIQPDRNQSQTNCRELSDTVRFQVQWGLWSAHWL